jgi:hypothetical protein
MKSVLGFFSLLAFGFLAAGVLAVIGSSEMSRAPFQGIGNGEMTIDLGSLLLGLAAGLLLSALARVSWAELPGRTVTWLLANERNFARLAWAVLFGVILLFY